MKNFENITNEENEKILKQVQNLPEDSRNSVDLYMQSYNEFSRNWDNTLKEFDAIYSHYGKVNYKESSKEQSNKNNK